MLTVVVHCGCDTMTVVGTQGRTPRQATTGREQPEFDWLESSRTASRSGSAEHASDVSIPSARGVFELVGRVVAPSTLLVALAFYFGWVLTNSRASYFGIAASALGFSTQDYLLRGVDALFVPMGRGGGSRAGRRLATCLRGAATGPRSAASASPARGTHGGSGG